MCRVGGLKAERRLADIARRTLVAADVDALRGLEGEAALAHAQAQLLARTLRGDLDGYPAFIWR